MIAAMKVACPACGQRQGDRGRGATCGRCGFSPLPSYSYPKRSCFHAEWRPRKRRSRGPIALR